jgi:hypothetical protein
LLKGNQMESRKLKYHETKKNNSKKKKTLWICMSHVEFDENSNLCPFRTVFLQACSRSMALESPGTLEWNLDKRWSLWIVVIRSFLGQFSTLA